MWDKQESAAHVFFISIYELTSFAGGRGKNEFSMKRIKYFVSALLACAMVGLAPSCSKDEPGGGGNSGGSMSGDGDYGKLGDNMVATGGTRAVSYTQGILLGTVDFSKLGDTHTFGVVYMEGVEEKEGQKPYDYNLYLVYNGDDVEEAQVNTTADGKFEKQLVDLMPGTTYYYRSYIKIGSTYNYAEVRSFSTLDPSSQINLVTGDPTEVCALSTMLVGRASIGNVNNGLDQIEIKDQEYGFIYSDDVALGTAETLTMEYWENWDNTHFDTQLKPDEPKEVLTDQNANTVLQQLATELVPGTTYYYRTVFVWNGKYFYSPEVKTFTTLGPSSLTVGTLKPEEVGETSAMLKGHVPFEKIGVQSVNGGFMISKKYTNKSEFVMYESMNMWPSSSDISYVSCLVSEVDFITMISHLEPNTEYHVCAFVELGKEKDTTDKYDQIVKGKPIYLYGDVITFKTLEHKADINIESTYSFPWKENTQTGEYLSTNDSQRNSSSALFIQVRPEVTGTLNFDWTVDSERDGDFMNIYVVPGIKSTVPSSTYLEDQRSGKESGKFSYKCNSVENFTVVVQYKKDSQNDSGRDRVVVSNIRYE